ncbi:MAG: choice-of-anchor D domain-containing protein [Deltaproteobacteria bacterium]|nr:choice-of-anchor D domain-containing protein [Deltaproteobacteria bacterium]
MLLHAGLVYTAATVRTLVSTVLLFGCNPDNELSVVQPEIVVEPSTIDIGETVLQEYTEVTATVRNDGMGTLKITSADWETGASPDLEVISFPAELSSGESGDLVIRHTPDIEEQDWGTLTLLNNQPGKERFPVTVGGTGTKPCIDIDPELLHFGTVTPGESVTKEFQVRSGCSGSLRITNAVYAGNEDEAYDAQMPEDWTTPYSLRNGKAFTVAVTFTPPDTNEWSGELWFTSNDPEQPTAAVSLKGNTVDDPTENECPVVEITEPDVGEYLMDDRNITMTGVVYDADEETTNLVCAWFADNDKVADATVFGEGDVATSSKLPIGTIDLELRCFDSEGCGGEDHVTVTVWDHEEPVQYTISGGDTIYDYFGVDDDLLIELNGNTLFNDDNDTQDNLAPITFDAMSGDVLRLVAVDQNATEGKIQALTLHWGTGESQNLNSEICVSSDFENACYDGTYSGPWPNVMLDDTYTISIP